MAKKNDERDDYCGDCGWCADDYEDARLKPCPNCNILVCFECRDKNGRCSHCAEYNMPSHVCFVTDQDNHKKRNIDLMVMKFYGCGIHYHMSLESVKGHGRSNKPFNKDGETRIDEKFDTIEQMNEYLLRFFNSLSKRRKWYINESSENVRQYFYKEGD